MQHQYHINSIGQVQRENEGFLIQLDKQYQSGLANIDGFSHLQIVWWGHLTDSQEQRSIFTTEKLFKKGPEKMGIFATRVPARPNPLLISTIAVDSIDPHTGRIKTPFIDAEPGSPVLDIKPYFPMERVKDCKTPAWCAHWPAWAEEARQFAWNQEINFQRCSKL